ncbi:hypothetical protein MNBD_GAMMA26-912 [hydrothermal vent metagenome]|uniref:Uncharacterized protein n=1 Tax=hydrothermal vent metagenome TaxID=652676 RepID=A0A3B1B3R6_9ZZZZ
MYRPAVCRVTVGTGRTVTDPITDIKIIQGKG